MLKRVIEQDIDLNLFSCSEFSDTHDFNGFEVVCIVDSQKENVNDAMQGISNNQVTVILKQDSIPRLPLNGEEFLLDGSLYVCTAVTHEYGIEFVYGNLIQSR